jgi:hypothetical protein
VIGANALYPGWLCKNGGTASDQAADAWNWAQRCITQSSLDGFSVLENEYLQQCTFVPGIIETRNATSRPSLILAASPIRARPV